MGMLTRIRKHTTMIIRSYYMNTGRLSISYDCGNGGYYVFMCTDAENALEKVSSGKCHLGTVERAETEVICGVG